MPDTIKTNSLKEVLINVRKKLIEQKVDRTIFNIENSISSSIGDALDVLKITPSIKIKNNDISMIGKSTVSIMIDDILIQLSGDDLISFLKTIKSDNIKSIEVITNPPAKYDAEGNSGIINIKLKGAIKDSWFASINSIYRQNSYPLWGTGGSFKYNKNKISLNSNINYTSGSLLSTEIKKAYYSNKDWFQEEKNKYSSKDLGVQFGLEYKISNHMSMGIQYKGSFNNSPINKNIKSEFFSKQNFLDSLSLTNSNQGSSINLNNLNYSFIYKIDSIGRKLSLYFDFFDYSKTNDRNFLVDDYSKNNFLKQSYKYKNTGLQDNTNFSLNLDMDHPFKNININYGIKLYNIRTKNNFLFYNLISDVPIKNLSQSNSFKFKENTQSIYFSADKSLGDKWSVKLGIRLENTNYETYSETLDQTNNVSYAKIFPTGYISYEPNKNNTFNINYGKRINRPRFNWLNPFRIYSNIFIYQEGNPYLRPSFSDNLEFNYTYKSNLNIRLYYSNLKNGAEQVTFLSPDNPIIYTKPVNYITTNSYGGSVYYSFKKSEFWELSTSFDYNFSYSHSSIVETNQELKGSQAFLQLNNMFNITSNISFNLNYWYQFKGVDGLDRNTDSNELNAVLRFILLKKQLQVTISANDIFSSNRTIYSSYTNNINIKYKNYYDNRNFSISMIYNFGNKNIKSSNLSPKNTEEQDRLD